MRLPSEPPRKGRIEIIPMIDTIFFLLVYFIMTSLSLVQMETHGVQLPVSRTSGERPTDRVVVTVAPDGAIFADADRVSEAELLNRVRQSVEANPQIVVVLNADKNANVQAFLRVLDLVKQANPARVQIATAPPDTPQAPTSYTDKD